MNEEMMDQAIEAEYTLEYPASCPHCKADVEKILVIRLLRSRVNFTSALPRRGQAMLCPHCRAMVAGSLGGIL